MGKDYYKTLGIEKNATEDEIKKAFRKLAHQYHPDKKTGDEAKFKEVNEAYQTLSDTKKRASYDRFGSGNGQSGGGAHAGGFGGFNSSSFEGFDFGNVGDIFSDFFGGSSGQSSRKRGEDIQIQILITLKDSVFGVERKVLLTKTNACNTCSGTGAKSGSKQNTCKTCNGQGRVQQARRSVFGTVNTVVECDTCQGSGKIPEHKCTDCKGKGIKDSQSEIKIQVPAGIENGQTLRMNGQGEAINGGAAGDLYVLIQVDKDPSFVRRGFDLHTQKTLKLTEALLGTSVKIISFDGEENLVIPAGVSNGDILKISGKGVTKNQGARGDVLVTIKIVTPNKLSKEAVRLIEELRKEGL